MNPLLEKLTARQEFRALATAWGARTPRERLLIASAAVLCLIALLIMLLGWIGSERQRLARSLPRAEQQLAQMQAALAELTTLQSQPSGLAGATEPPARLVQEMVQAAGLGLSVTGERDSVRLEGRAPFDRLVELLGQLHQTRGLRLVRLDMQEDGAAAVISATLEASR